LSARILWLLGNAAYARIRKAITCDFDSEITTVEIELMGLAEYKEFRAPGTNENRLLEEAAFDSLPPGSS